MKFNFTKGFDTTFLTKVMNEAFERLFEEIVNERMDETAFAKVRFRSHRSAPNDYLHDTFGMIWDFIFAVEDLPRSSFIEDDLKTSTDHMKKMAEIIYDGVVKICEDVDEYVRKVIMDEDKS